ncbi:MAPEG family protein [Polymorphobacter sp. PAMC 29334]|uniref:MAPEG family protein n=1 Tax=Polymorphobacter sp. PAMC 29334 TaxID=2862331 RepID=UPI001C66F446|nr:MAPEG family protein [Polymorphobacter sp. PAMC 29334]QYE34332.1 MAPEG family protein [Polymorphobacter sp. PAMC 29334]
MTHHLPLTEGALIAALAIYVWSGIRVSQARTKFGVMAPTVTGAPEFERAFRAQQNTVEQMVLFVPLLGLAALFWGDLYAGAYGAIWSVGRLIYIETYIRAADKRSLGFLLSGVLSLIVLIAVIVSFTLHQFGIG